MFFGQIPYCFHIIFQGEKLLLYNIQGERWINSSPAIILQLQIIIADQMKDVVLLNGPKEEKRTFKSHS